MAVMKKGNTKELPGNSIVIFFAFVFLFTPPAYGQQKRPEPHWWNNNKVVMEIALSDKQIAGIEKINRECEKKHFDLMSQYRKSRIELLSLLDDEHLNVKNINNKQKEINRIRERILRNRIEAKIKTKQMVGPDQFSELRKLKPWIMRVNWWHSSRQRPPKTIKGKVVGGRKEKKTN